MIKNLIEDIRSEVTNSILFWNALYYIALIGSMFYDMEIATGIWGVSSIIGLLLGFGAVFDEDDNFFIKHLWIYTTIVALMIYACVILYFIAWRPISFLIKKFNNWLNNLGNSN